MTHACEKEKTKKEIKEMFVSESGSTSHMANNNNNMTDLREVKTVVKAGKNKTMTSSL